MPGTATTSSPRTTSGHASRSDRGILASTNTSWIFFERPTSRSPGLQPRTLRPSSGEVMRHAPQRTSPSRSTGPRSSHRRSYSRTACTPPPRSTRFEPAGDASSSASAGGSVALRVEGAQDVLVGGGMELPEQRQDLVADQAALRVRVGRVDAELEPLAAAVRLGLVPPDGQQRMDDAVLPPRLDPGGGAARGEPVDDRLDLVRGGVAGRAQDGRARASSAGRAARPR